MPFFIHFIWTARCYGIRPQPCSWTNVMPPTTHLAVSPMSQLVSPHPSQHCKHFQTLSISPVSLGPFTIHNSFLQNRGWISKWTKEEKYLSPGESEREICAVHLYRWSLFNSIQRIISLLSCTIYYYFVKYFIIFPFAACVCVGECDLISVRQITKVYKSKRVLALTLFIYVQANGNRIV